MICNVALLHSWFWAAVCFCTAGLHALVYFACTAGDERELIFERPKGSSRLLLFGQFTLLRRGKMHLGFPYTCQSWYKEVREVTASNIVTCNWRHPLTGDLQPQQSMDPVLSSLHFWTYDGIPKTRLTVNILKQDPTHKRLKKTLFIRAKHRMRMFSG